MPGHRANLAMLAHWSSRCKRSLSCPRANEAETQRQALRLNPKANRSRCAGESLSGYAIENYPQRKGITTHYISGDDHEGWWIHRECVNVGEYFEMRAKKAGPSTPRRTAL
jgi:hypothetical protein